MPDIKDGIDLADIIVSLTKDNGLICEVLGSFIDKLMKEKKISYAEIVSAISYARLEWDV